MSTVTVTNPALRAHEGIYVCPACGARSETYVIVDVCFAGGYSSRYSRVVKIGQESPGDLRPMLRGCVECGATTVPA